MTYPVINMLYKQEFPFVYSMMKQDHIPMEEFYYVVKIIFLLSCIFGIRFVLVCMQTFFVFFVSVFPHEDISPVQSQQQMA